MYQASKKFGDAIAGSNRKFNTRLLENEKVLVESVKSFTITSGAEEITIGSAVASYIQATVENKGISLSGKEVSLEIGVEVDGEMEYIPMGLYTIQNPKIESNKVTFTAYDRLASRCNGAYYSKLAYPVDAVDILAEISTMTGVAIDTSTLQRGIQINQRAIIEEGDYNEETEESEVITTYVNPFDGYTYKETIGFIAGLFGKFAICGRTGMIEFRWYQDISYEIQSNIFYNDLQETEESFSIKRLTCDNSDQTLSSGSGATGISMQNPVMTQSILDSVYNTVQGLVFTPAALRFIGDMRLDIGDIVTAVKNDGTKFTIPIISLITSFDGGLMQTVASYGNTAEEDDSDTKGPLTEMAERVEYELAFVKKLMVDNLVATNATIKNLSGDILDFKTGDFENLKADVANFKNATADNLNAANAKISNLEADQATFKEATAENLNASNARITNIEADYLKATDAQLTYATITNLNTANAAIEKLQTKDAEIDKLVATKATITDLNAAVGRVGVLESGYADLNTLVNGNLTSDNIQSLTLNSKNTTIENGMIKNAMIENLSFDKITGMDINTTNLTVHSSDGKSKWSDNTIQISDANRVRVQIGKDASNDYSMSVWDKNGNLIWDALGATEKTIQRKIIRDGIVADDANISGSKLDINSVIKEVNGSTTKLKSSTIVMNDKNQTLDIAFNEMETTVANNLNSAKLYADGKLSDAQKYALEQANSALSSAKSYADSAVDNIEVGGRNLILNSAFKKSRKEWTDWGNPTTREIVSSNGKMWAHIVGNKQNYQGFNQWTPAGSIKEGDHITFSARIKGSAANQKFSVGIHWLNSSNIIINQDWHIFTVDTTENIYTWTVDAKGSGCDKLNLMVGVSDTSAAYNVYFTEIMVVKGNKSSDWTPAPEDTQSQIDNITEITTSHTTSISTMQGQISSLISEDTTIKGNYDALLSRYNTTVATVDSMKTTIGEHTTILNNQNDSIAAVTTKANTIESNLAGTTQTVSEVKSNLAGTQERVTKVETSLTGLTTRVSSTETNLANLEIGGRNLVLRSKDFTSGDDYWYINGNYRKSIDDDGFTIVSISRSGAGLEWNRIIPHAFIPVEEMHRGIIVSFDFMCDKVSELDRGCICALQTYNSGGGRIGWYESQDILSGTQCKLSAPLSDGKWIRVQVPFSEGDLKKTYGSSNAVAYTSVSLQLVSNGSIHFKKVKIEYGSKATDYTEAPEDVDQQITAAETIASQTADKFNWLVKSGTNSTDFELTDRTATLVASAINMHGLVTFSGLNADAKNEIGKVAQSKVDGLEVGGRNLARGTSNEYSTPYTNFNGSANTCFDIGRVYLDDLKAGDTITVHMYIKYDNLVAASGKTIQMWLQGHGNVTLWNGGSFPSTLRPSFSGSGVYELLYSVALDSYHEKNQYWVCGIRTDYIQSGSVQVKSFKVEKGNKATDWTPAPEDYLPQASLVSNWTTNTTWIDGSKIYTGSITADKIDVNSIFAKDITATGTITGVNLIGATGTFSGQINATKGTVGGWNIATNGLYSGIDENAIKIYSATTYDAQTMYQKQKIQDSFILSQKYINHFVSQQVSVGHNIPYWQTRSFIYNDSQIQLAHSDYCINTSSASNYDTQYSLKDGYISATRIYMEQNITQVGGDVINSSFSIGLDSMMGWCSMHSTKGINIYGDSSRALYVQSNDTSNYNALETEGDVVVNGKIHAVSGDNKIQLNSNNNGSIELYGNTPFIDFHCAYSSADYTCRIIANTPEQLLVCGKLRCDSNIISNNDLIANSWIYAGQNAHYTWQNQSDCYFSCGYYNNTNNVYYYAGYHAFYVNNDSGSGMMYIETSGVSSRKGFRNSSDERIKKDFRHFDDDFIKTYMQLEPIKYRFKDDTDNSYHIGFKAQNVNGVLNNYGKSHNEQFGICATHHIDPEYAEKTYGEKNMTEVYTLAYDELIGANTFMIQKTRKDLMYQAGRIDMQEAIINDLQARLLQAEKTIKQLTQALA